MERLSNQPFNDPGARFSLDNLRDGFKDDSLLIWHALDTKEDKSVWVLGRKMKGQTLQVIPCAILFSTGREAVERYAPAKPGGGWDTRQIPGKRLIITPPGI
jgi:hypothetical protein